MSEAVMKASLRAFLERLIDYAGLFPPARLPLHEAIHNYAAYREAPDHWMLGRFICPAAQLSALDPFVEELFQTGPPLTLSALGGAADSARAWHDSLRQDVEAIATFRARHGDRVQVEALEVRLPLDVEGLPPPVLQDFLRRAEEITGGALELYYEPALRPQWRMFWGKLAGVLAELGKRAGLKVRCGGLEAAAFPTAEQLASVIAACRDGGLPLKATAGLHHPFPRPDEKLGVTTHGFVNVFAAGVLACARRLAEERVKAILEDADPAHFHFDADKLAWDDVAATTEEITAARRSGVTSFGSCSFDEPRDDLRALNLLGVSQP
jgi:hypothetical protein